MVAVVSLPSRAFEALYLDHHGWLLGLLRRRLGCAHQAADLAHDAYVRLLASPREFDGFEGARAYLSRVAQGLCIDLWRRREIERAWLDALAAQPEPVVASAEQQAIVLETLYEIDAMLRELPDKVASAFLMAQVAGMTYREIAADLGVSDRMVKKYMARAMLHCACFLADWGSAVPTRIPRARPAVSFI